MKILITVIFFIFQINASGRKFWRLITISANFSHRNHHLFTL